MTNIVDNLLQEIEATAAALGKSPSTIGEMVGQGGGFYARLKAGRDVRARTIEKVMGRLNHLKNSAAAPLEGSE